MNGLHLALLALAGGYVLLRLVVPRRPAIATGYARYLLLTLLGAIVLAPFAWLFSAAFKDKSVLMQFTFLPPLSLWSSDTLNLNNFRELFAGEETLQGRVFFWQYVVNSLFLAGAGTVISLFFSSLGGYALAKYTFRGKRALMGFMLGSMMLPGMLFLAPTFKLIYQIGWMDTYWAMLVPGAVSAFGMFLFRQASIGVPDSLIEAARIDGAGEFRIYLTVVMPLLRPICGAYCLMSFLGGWNAFIGPQVFLQTQGNLTLPVILNQYVGVYQQQYGVFLAGTLIAIIPPAIIFFALQREFISGLATGAVKG